MSDISAAPAGANAVAAASPQAEPVLGQSPAAPEAQPAEANVTAANPPPPDDPKALKRWQLKRILAVVGAVLCVLGVAAGAGAAIVGARPDQVEVAVNTPSTFYALPDLIATLAPEGRRAHRVRLGVTLEVEEANLPQVQAQEQAIVAAMQDLLLDLHTADLVGRSGAENLRTFIREVVDGRTTPGLVRTILFTTFIVD